MLLSLPLDELQSIELSEEISQILHNFVKVKNKNVIYFYSFFLIFIIYFLAIKPRFLNKKFQ